MSKVAVSNGCIIDEYCRVPEGEIVMKNGTVYNCTLNQTDIGENKNKFYIMQLLKYNNKYYRHVRYGRIGERGTVTGDEYSDEYEAIMSFCKQFKSKTGNNWGTEFIKKSGKYFMSDVKYDDIMEITKKPVEKTESLLDIRVQNLISLISDTTMMTNALISMDVDTKKMPLGKISKSQINVANEILKEIINAVQTDPVLNLSILEDLSGKFYTYIPYACGRKKPPIINDNEMIGKYSQLLEELENMIIATNLIDNQTCHNPIDSIYNNLNTTIKGLDRNSQMWEIITDYVINTHGSTHKISMEILDIYEISRNDEQECYNEYSKKIPNKQLLFHGSRLSNFCSILQRGLILNPESLGVPIAGKMFGYGVYGANCITKSCQYTNAKSSNNIGALLLCEFALGNQYKCISSDSNANKDKLARLNCHSTWGQGKMTPNGGITILTSDGSEKIFVPNGKLESSKISSDLLYDEFIIYDTKQLLLKYLILFKQK